MLSGLCPFAHKITRARSASAEAYADGSPVTAPGPASTGSFMPEGYPRSSSSFSARNWAMTSRFTPYARTLWIGPGNRFHRKSLI
jgi:hypothetical protein